MADNYAPPSRNPADNDTLTGLLRLVLAKFLQATDDMLPAKVIAYDPKANMAQVQPIIAVVSTANQMIPRAQVAAVPVLQMSGGGFMLRFPITPGDLGWIKSNDRDISLFKQTLQQAQPNTQRKHSFEDAIFIPQAAWNLITLAEEDTANAVFQNYDGSVKIALWNDLIKILVPKGVGIGGTPDSNAILDLQSTTKAFLPPRMTVPQRDAIPNPQEGMTVWLTDLHGFSSYNSATHSWS
ncbi:MAG TPA: Gp138 family membrane-puncturing spike protein [Gemmataceae bacterium]|nr:Gp138 family membrane-puncturing spike protein [Gemmataceae bacterium]